MAVASAQTIDLSQLIKQADELQKRMAKLDQMSSGWGRAVDQAEKNTEDWNKDLKRSAADTFKIKENLNITNRALRMIKMQDMTNFVEKLLRLDILPDSLKGVASAVGDIVDAMTTAGKEALVGVFDAKTMGTTYKRLKAIQQTIDSMGGENQMSERALAGMEKAKRDTSLEGYAGLQSLGWDITSVKKMDTAKLYIESLRRAKGLVASRGDEESQKSYYTASGIEDALGIDFETLRTINVEEFGKTFDKKLAGMKNWDEKVLAETGSIYTDMQHSLDNLRLTIFTHLSPLFKSVIATIEENMPELTAAIDKAVKWLIEYEWKELWGSIKNTFQEWMPKIWKVMQELWEAVKQLGVILGTWDRIKKIASGDIMGAAQDFYSVTPEVTEDSKKLENILYGDPDNVFSAGYYDRTDGAGPRKGYLTRYREAAKAVKEYKGDDLSWKAGLVKARDEVEAAADKRMMELLRAQGVGAGTDEWYAAMDRHYKRMGINRQYERPVQDEDTKYKISKRGLELANKKTQEIKITIEDKTSNGIKAKQPASNAAKTASMLNTGH